MKRKIRDDPKTDLVAPGAPKWNHSLKEEESLNSLQIIIYSIAIICLVLGCSTAVCISHACSLNLLISLEDNSDKDSS